MTTATKFSFVSVFSFFCCLCSSQVFGQVNDHDGDSVSDEYDNCPGTFNTSHDDMGLGLVCVTADDCLDNEILLSDGTPVPVTTNPWVEESALVLVFCVESVCVIQADADFDGIGDVCDADDDNDHVPDDEDNCPEVRNTNQENADNDEFGDACDADQDNDHIPNDEDNCPIVYNPRQYDVDEDGVGSTCDLDDDNDGIRDIDDLDCDGDGIPEGHHLPNLICVSEPDFDGDGFIGCPEGVIAPDCDCVEGNSNLNPAEDEICDDYMDNNCDGLIDEEDTVACPSFQQ